MYAFIRKQGLQVLNCIDEVVLIALVCYLLRRQLTVPEGVVSQSDDIEVHTALNQLVVVKRVTTRIGRTVGVNDDLCIRAFFAHRIASGFEQTQITVPVVACFFVRVYLNAA